MSVQLALVVSNNEYDLLLRLGDLNYDKLRVKGDITQWPPGASELKAKGLITVTPIDGQTIDIGLTLAARYLLRNHL